MKLLPSAQTEEQLRALRQLLDEGEIVFRGEDGCEVASVTADAGSWWTKQTGEWQDVGFNRALLLVQDLAKQGYKF